MALDGSSLVVEPLKRGQLFLAAEFRALGRRLQHSNRLIVNPKGHRKRMPVLAAMRKGETRRVGEPVWRAMHDLGDHRQRTHGPRTDAWNGRQVYAA